jgi:[acyl-carrier-protein] S-malonyltransferase
LSRHLGFVFPGQGSQSVGMLADLGTAFPLVKETFDQASEVLGYDLWGLVQYGPEEMLNRTECTQPAMLAAGMAVWRVWRTSGGALPAVMAGHSLGEYTALVCAGSLVFEEAVALVTERGRLMQRAVPEGQGAMAAILGLDDARVADLCQAAARGRVVEPANLNAPGQVVVAGDAGAVEDVLVLARQAGAKRSVRLAVSIPSHCSLMKRAAERLGERLQGLGFKSPGVPVIHDVDAAMHPQPKAIREALVAQLHRPVRWAEVMQRIQSVGVDAVVECGPGKVLAGLAKRTVAGLTAYPAYDQVTLRKALAAAS